MKRNAEVGLPLKLSFFLWERHLMAAVAFGEGRLPRRSWLEATPTRAFITAMMAPRATTGFLRSHQ
jgi:hypothetical protein